MNIETKLIHSSQIVVLLDKLPCFDCLHKRFPPFYSPCHHSKESRRNVAFCLFGHFRCLIGSEGEPELIKPYDDLLGGPRVYHAIKQCPNVVAMIAGHVHYDNLLYDDGIVSVTSLSSLAQEWSPLCPKREFGTITETAFDVFSFKDNHIYITRFGAGEDRMATMLRY